MSSMCLFESAGMAGLNPLRVRDPRRLQDFRLSVITLGMNQTAHSPKVAYSLAFLVVLGAGLLSGQQVATWPVRIRYPCEQSFVEGMRLAEMVHLRQGLRIYDPPTPERFDAAIYGPLYYLLGARLVDFEEPSLLPLRLISLIGTLGCMVECALLAFWISKSPAATALAPLLFLSYGIVTFYGSSARCVLVALALLFGGFLFSYRFRNCRVLLLGAPLMLLGFFYKQQFVAAPLAVLLFLLVERRYRLAAEFGGLITFGGLASLGFFQFVIFRGQAFLAHFLRYNMLPLTPAQFAAGAAGFVLMLLVPLLLGLKHLRAHQDKLLACYLGSAVFLALATLAKEGSSTNYYLECVLILSPVLAALLRERAQEPAYAAGLLAVLILSFLSGRWFARPQPEQIDFARDRAVQDYLREHFSPRTPALSVFTGDLVRAGLDAPVSDLYQYTQLIRKGTLSDRDLLGQLRARRFGVIALNFDLESERNPQRLERYLTEPLRRSILANYRPSASLDMPAPEKLYAPDRFYLWIPENHAAVTPSPDR